VNQEIENLIIEKHIKFYNVVIGLSSTIAIILIYTLGSSLFNFYFFYSKSNQLVNPLSIVLSQIFLLLIPSVLMVFILKAPMREFFPMKLPSLKFILLSIVGIVTLLTASEAYLQIQEYLVPEGMKKIYTEIVTDYENMIGQLIGKGNFLLVLQGFGVLALVPAIAEEFLFRGYLQRSLMKGLKPMTAIVITALIFSVSHLNVINIIPLAFIGFYLGYVSYLSSSLLIPIILHFVNNTISVLSFYFNESNQIDSVVISNSHINISMIVFGVAASMTIGLLWYLNKNYNPSIMNHPAEDL
jgi:membrane protease YdiL (CAAX protease family)